LANRESRITVSGATLRTTAVSSTVSPSKKRISITWLRRWSSFASATSASSSATRSGSGLERVTDAFHSHVAPSDPMELPFDCRNNTRQRFFIAVPPRHEQARYIEKQARQAPILRLLPRF
jgi:hypothetical protein